MSYDKLDELFDALKADGAVSANGKAKFKADMTAPGAAGYRNRLRLYNALKADGVIQSKTYEDFAAKLGMHAVNNKSQHTGGWKPSKQQMQQYNDFFVDGLSSINGMRAHVAQHNADMQQAWQSPLNVSKPQLDLKRQAPDLTELGQAALGAGGVKDISKPGGKSKYQTEAGNVYDTQLEALTEQAQINKNKSDYNIMQQVADIDKQIAVLQAEDDKRVRDNKSTRLYMPGFAESRAMALANVADDGSILRKNLGKISELQNKKAMLLYGTSMGSQVGSNINSMLSDIDKRNAKYIDEQRNARLVKVNGHVVYAGGQGDISADIGNPYLNTAKDALKDAKKIFDEAGRNAAGQGIVGGIYHGLKDGMVDVRTWDMGLNDMLNADLLRRTLRKADSGKPLSKDEQTLLDAKALEMATYAYFNSAVGRSYKAGNVTAESLPFMLEMIINPASGAGRSAQAMLTRYALKRFGSGMVKEAGEAYARQALRGGVTQSLKAIAQKGINKEARGMAIKATAGKVGARVLGDAAGAMGMTATTGQLRTVADMLNRTTGQARYKFDDNTGNIVYAGHDNPDESSLFKAYSKAFFANTIENHSEFLGEYFPLFGRLLKSGLDKAGGRVLMEYLGHISNSAAKAFMRLPKADMIADFVRNATKNDYTKMLSQMQKRAHWDGVLNEYLEEVAGNIENALIVGDNTFDAAKDTGVFNKDVNIDTFLGVALMSGAFSVMGAAGYRTPSYRARKAVQRAGQDAKAMLGESAYSQLVKDIDNAQNEQEKAVVLNAVLTNRGYSPKERAAALTYVRARQFQEGVQNGTIKLMEDEDTPQEERACIAAYEQGQSLDNIQDKMDAKTDYDNKRWLAEQAVSDAAYYSDPQFYAQIHQDATPEQIKAMTEYANAKAKYEGVIDQIKANAESLRQKNEEAVGNITSDQGTIVPVEVNGRLEDMYIRNGKVVFNDDGTVNHALSDQTICITDTSGKTEMVDVHTLIKATSEAADAEQRLDEINEQAERQVKAESDAVDGVRTFAPGETFAIMSPEGELQHVTIVQDQQTGQLAAYVAEEGTSIPLDDRSKQILQNLSNNAQQARWEDYQRQRAEAERQAEEETAPEEESPTAENTDYEDSQADAENTQHIQQGQQVQFVDANGDIHTGEVLNSTPDGDYEVQFDKGFAPEGKSVVDTYTEAEVRGMMPQTENTNSGTYQPTQPRAIDRIKTDEAGNRIYEESSLEDTCAALIEGSNGDVDDALDTARLMLKKSKAKLNGQKAALGKADTVEAIQAAKAKVKKAEHVAEYWEQVVSMLEEIKVREQRSAETAEREGKRNEAKKHGAYTVAPSIKEKWDNGEKIVGASDEYTLPNGKSLKGHYVLAESGTASASHQSTNEFAKTEGYPTDENGNSVNDRDYENDHEAQRITRQIADKYDQRAIQSPVVVSQDGVVLSGNGRTIAGELAAEQGTDSKYVSYLREHANKYGFTEEQVDGMEHPRLLFVADEALPYTADTFAMFNHTEQKTQSKTEQAVKMGKVVDDATFGRVSAIISGFDTLADFYRDDKATHSVINELERAGVIQQSQMAEIFDGESLSDIGKALVEGVLIGKVFKNNPEAVRQITAIKSMRQSIASALQEIVANTKLGNGYDLSEELAKAIDLVYQARMHDFKHGQKVSQYAYQGNLFAEEEGSQTMADFNNAMILMLADVINDKRVTQLKKVMDAYNHRAEPFSAGVADMFEGMLTKEQVLNNIIQYFYGDKGKKSEQENGQRSNGATEENAQSPAPDGSHEDGGRSVSESAPASSENVQGNKDDASENEMPPVIGKAYRWGNVYQWGLGKVKSAFDFLLKNQSGLLCGVFHRDDIGDIALGWGEAPTDYTGRGLSHIIRKHIKKFHDFKNIEEMMNVIDDVIKNGVKREDGDNTFAIENDTYRVVIVKDSDGTWILSAFDHKHSKKTKLAKAKKEKDAAALGTPSQPNVEAGAVTSNPSTDKGTESTATVQGNGEETSNETRNGENQAKHSNHETEGALRQDLVVFREAMRRMFPEAREEFLDQVVRGMAERPLTEQKQKEMEALASAFGIQVKWVDTMKQNGTFDPKTKTITVARDSWNPLANTFGHELTHALRQLSEDAYRDLLRSVKSGFTAEEWKQALEDRYKSYKEEEREEEMVADMVGQLVNAGQLVKPMLRKVAPTTMQKIGDAVSRMWQAVRKAAGKEDKGGEVSTKVKALLDAVQRAKAESASKPHEAQRMAVSNSLRDGTFIQSGSYFSGGGLLEEGLKNYLDPKVAVEYSEKISGVYADNFGNHIVTADVRNVDPRALTKDLDGGSVEYFHASPVCKNFSKAKRDAGEVELDKETAQSTADFIRENRPKVVTIENVKGYRGSEALSVITDELDRQGYKWDMDVYNTADYGGYTKRERLIVRAVRDGELPPKPEAMPREMRPQGWMEAVEDLLPSLPEKKSGVPKWMDERLKAEGIDYRNIDKPLYVFGQGNSATSVSHAFADELLPTLRTKGGDVIIMPDGRVLRATPRVLARVTGLSDDYKMPHTDDLAHTIVGNGIPTQLTANVIGPMLEDVFNGGEKVTRDVKASEREREQQREDEAKGLGVDQATIDGLKKHGLTIEGGIVVNKTAADFHDAIGYVAPNDRIVDEDIIQEAQKESKRTISSTISRLNDNGENEIADMLMGWQARIAAQDAAAEIVDAITPEGNYTNKPTRDKETKEVIKTKTSKNTSPIREQGDIYGFTVDFDTACPNRFLMGSIVRRIEQRIGEPLTITQYTQLSELLRAFKLTIPCTYCYVENKRQGMKDAMRMYQTAKDAVWNAKTPEEEWDVMYGHSSTSTRTLTEAAEKQLARWRKAKKAGDTFNPSLKSVVKAYEMGRNAALYVLDELKQDGEVDAYTGKDTLVSHLMKAFNVKVDESNFIDKASVTRIKGLLKGIALEWKWDMNNKVAHKDYSGTNGRMLQFDKRMMDYYRAMELYSISSSGAKAELRYAPYTDEVKLLKKSDLDKFRAIDGLRMHSNNDFRLDYLTDYLQFFADITTKHIPMQTYTKSPAFVQLFGNIGIRINMSCAMYGGVEGQEKIMANESEGFNWEEAKRLREAYPNAGVMMMVTNDNQLSMAINADWIDMIIPFHASNLPKRFWNDMRRWHDYTSTNKEKMKSADTMRRELEADGVEVPKKNEDVLAVYDEHFNIPKYYEYNKRTKEWVRSVPHFAPRDRYVNGPKGKQFVPGHNNDKSTYMKLCEQYGLVPMFKGHMVDDGHGNQIDVTEHPNYIKLVKEVARTDSEQPNVDFTRMNDTAELSPVMDEEKARIVFGDKIPEDAIGRHMTYMEWGFSQLYDFAKQGGYENVQDYNRMLDTTILNDRGQKYDIADEFIKEYIQQERPLGWLPQTARDYAEFMTQKDVVAAYGQMPYEARDNGSDQVKESQRIPSSSEAALRDALVEQLRKSGVSVSLDEKEGQKVMDLYYGNGVRTQAMLFSLVKAANTIRGWLANNKRGKSFTLELPQVTQRMIRNVMGRNYDSHNITANNIAHAYANHGVGGSKITDNSIPLTKEDMELMPYIMTAPDYVQKGSEDITGRESIRFYKTLSNGYVVVVEKEQKNSPDDMETITMWAEMSSSDVADARNNTSPAIDVRNVIISTEDAAKIRRDAEIAIAKDQKLREHRVYHGSGADFEAFDHSHMGEGEGAQAYGWGTYVTEVEGIGRTYANTIGGRNNNYDMAKFHYDSLKDTYDLIDKQISTDYSYLELYESNLSKYKNSDSQYKAYNIEKTKKVIRELKQRIQEREISLVETEERLIEAKERLDALPKPEHHLYTVEIPDDNGSNYLAWERSVSAETVDRITEYLREKYGDDVVNGKWLSNPLLSSKGVDESARTGEAIYHQLERVLGSDKKASQALADMGFVGVSVPTNYLSHGTRDNTRNYVIFKEKDAKITDHVRFFKTKDGEAYGFTVGGKVYIDPRHVNAETPIHEYAHLWATAMQEQDAKGWQDVVGLMKDTKVWDEVKETYPDLKTDDEIADEVLATYSGRRGAERLREEMRKVAEGRGGIMEKADALSALERVRMALRRFWRSVAKMLGIPFRSAEDVADKVMSDLLEGRNVTEGVETDGKVRKQTSSELTEKYGTRWLDEQTNEDGRHTTQVKNTINSYKKFGEWVKKDSDGRKVSVLDASSGLGLGTEWMRENGIDAEDVEPYPSENRTAPTYSSYDDVKKKYDYIISNAVLNVIPDDWRADVLHNMADKLKVGGKMVINVRGAEGIRKQGKEGETRTTLDDPSEILVLRPNGSIKAYQKGFTKQELKTWCENELGDGYSVDVANKENAGGSYDTAVVVTKNADEGVRFSQRENGNPTKSDMQQRIQSWLSEENLEWAKGKDRDAIFEHFGNELEPVAIVPKGYLQYLGDGFRNNAVYSGKGYMIDHAVNHHAEEPAESYQHIQDILDYPDVVRLDNRKERPSLIFVKKYDNYQSEVVSVDDENGKLVIHKTFYHKRNMPQKALPTVAIESPSEDEITSISHSPNGEPARLDFSALDGQDKGRENSETLQQSSYESSHLRESRRNNSYQNGSTASYRRALARDMYEARVKTTAYQVQEALQDSMLGLRTAMMSILNAEGKTWLGIEDVKGIENPFLGENRLSSVNFAESKAYEREFLQPLVEAVAKLSKNADQRAELTDYMMAKHGLERNEVMAKRDAKKLYDAYVKKHPNGTRDLASFEAECRMRDYAGLTALTEKDNIVNAEAEAKRMVNAYEKNHDSGSINDLWSRIENMNSATLRKLRDCGIISTDAFNEISGMYSNYIPLRGFVEDTSADVYAYLSDGGNGAFNSPIKTAKGRKSKADDPLANMAQMMQSAILQGNRNALVKQKLLNFALNHPSDLISISEVWLGYDDASKEWRLMRPGDTANSEAIKEDDSADAVDKKVKDFESDMEALAKAEPNKYKKQSDDISIPYKVVERKNEDEHRIIVKRNGKDYVLTINGSPRAAQAVNGMTNPNRDSNGWHEKMFNIGEHINRALSQVYTSLNPDFVVSNLLRDAVYSSSILLAKESPSYAAKYWKNFAIYNPAHMLSLFSSYNRGTNPISDSEKLFVQFMMNGGETGFSSLKDINKYKDEINRAIKDKNRTISIRKGYKYAKEYLELLNGAVENAARFSAFVTSMNEGRGVERSIYDAKEISVNFDKKGAGDRFLVANGQTWIGNAASLASGFGRSLYVFWNATIQGTTNAGRTFKHHPWKMTTGTALLFGLGALAAMAGGDGDDDDYYNLPEYIRRTNLVFRFPGMNSWITIPLPVEYRSVYGLGELAYSIVSGKESLSNRELTEAIVGQLSQVMPIDFLEGGGGLHAFIPSSAKPVTEIIENKSWTGLPIYKDNEYNKNAPGWAKAYKSANPYIVAATKALSDATGGDMVVGGKIDLNPAQIEYAMNGYLGGLFNILDKTAKTAETIAGDMEYDPKNMFVVSRVIRNGDERTENKHINEEYHRISEDVAETNRQKSQYKQLIRKGHPEYKEKLDDLDHSEEYAVTRLYRKLNKKIRKMQSYIKDNDNLSEDELKQYESEIIEAKKNLVDKVKKLRTDK